MDPQDSPNEIDMAALNAVVRRCLASESAEVIEWRAKVLGGGLGAALGGGYLQRIEGTARSGGRIQTWSVVVKLLRPPAEKGTGLRMDQVDPGHQFYWKREAELYASGLLTDLPNGFAAPRCYRIDESAAGIRLWLEDVAESDGSRWSSTRYALAARHWVDSTVFISSGDRCRWSRGCAATSYAGAYPSLPGSGTAFQTGGKIPVYAGAGRTTCSTERTVSGLSVSSSSAR